jgi:dihydroflavonol-4-reductase
MDGSFPSYPLVQMPCVDVRDVAEAHLQAILKPEAAGRRFLMASESMWMGDICKILTDKWGKQYKIPQKQASKCMMTILSWFISDLKMIMPMWGREVNFDNKPAQEVLGINFIPMSQSIPEFTDTLIETGYMDPPKGQKK